MTTTDHDKLRLIIEAIRDEFIVASEAHDAFDNHHEAYAVIREEFEQEYWPLVCENPKKQNGQPILYVKDREANIRRRNAALRSELIQTAAMCLRALHDLC